MLNCTSHSTRKRSGGKSAWSIPVRATHTGCCIAEPIRSDKSRVRGSPRQCRWEPVEKGDSPSRHCRFVSGKSRVGKGQSPFSTACQHFSETEQTLSKFADLGENCLKSENCPISTETIARGSHLRVCGNLHHERFGRERNTGAAGRRRR